MARGDHLFVNRLGGIYSHHGIDCGDGAVIHFGAPNSYTPRAVSTIPLAAFARGDEVQVRDYSAFFAAVEQGAAAGDVLHSANLQLNRVLDALRGISVKDLDFSPDAIVARARSRLGERNFNLWLNNCEHFASWCVTGISSSEQILAIWRASLPPLQFMRFATRSWLGNTASQLIARD